MPSENHKPLTAAEIEGLRELEAKATKGEWHLHNNGAVDMVASTVSNWPVALKPSDADGHLICAMRNALPRLLSMLQMPSDAAVRAAVEFFSDTVNGYGSVYEMWRQAQTLLSHVRAVQSPRLTSEQERVLQHVVRYLLTGGDSDHGNIHGPEAMMLIDAFHEAFPEGWFDMASLCSRPPRLTEEQVEAVKWAYDFIAQYGFKASAWIDERDSQRESEEVEFDMCSGLAHFRAAFPGVFGQEG